MYCTQGGDNNNKQDRGRVLGVGVVPPTYHLPFAFALACFCFGLYLPPTLSPFLCLLSLSVFHYHCLLLLLLLLPSSCFHFMAITTIAVIINEWMEK